MYAINSEQFENEVIKCGKPVLVDFFAEWCGPCKALSPILEEISAEFKGNVKVVKMDVDGNMALASSYGVRSVPTLIFMKNGNIADKVTTVLPKGEIVGRLNALL